MLSAQARPWKRAGATVVIVFSVLAARALAGQGWHGDFGPPGVSGPAYSVLTFNDELVVGGDFRGAGDVTSQDLVTWDGQRWHAFLPSTTSPASPLRSVLALGTWSHSVVAAGPVSGGGWQALLYYEGSIQRLGDAVLSGTVVALLPYQDLLIAAGDVSIGSDPALRHILAFDGSDWVALGAAPDGPVSALAEYDGDLVAAGSFLHVGEVTANGVARWDGTQWRTMGSPPLPVSGVSALGVHQGAVYLAGVFAGADGASGRVFRWSESGWEPVGDTVFGSDAEHLTLISDGQSLYAVGFSSTIERWDGQAWTHVATLDAPLYGATVYHDEVVFAGSFAGVGGVHARGVAGWNGEEFVSMGFSDGASGPVNALASIDGRIVAGGEFAYAGSSRVNGLARWDGFRWSAFDGGVSTSDGQADWSVNSIAEFRGDLIAAGRFDLAGDRLVHNIARWNGASWEPLGDGLSDDADGGVVTALAVYRGNLIAAGQFTRSGAASLHFLAEWDGVRWRDLAPHGVGGYPLLNALFVWNDALVVGGRFTAIDGAPAHGVASWDGAQWNQLSTGLGNGEQDAVTYAFTEYDDRLVVGGHFASAGDLPAQNVAAWDGARWDSLGSGFQDGAANWPTDGLSTAAVYALASSGGVLYAGGDFHTAGQVPATGITQWVHGPWWGSVGGGIDPVLDFGSSVIFDGGATVRALLRFDESHLFVGGWFQRAGGFPADNIVWWGGDTPIPVFPPRRNASDAIEMLSAIPTLFHDVTTLRYLVRDTRRVSVSVHDMRGRLVATLFDAEQTSGAHEITWNGRLANGREARSGMYAIHLRSGDQSVTQRVVHLVHHVYYYYDGPQHGE